MKTDKKVSPNIFPTLPVLNNLITSKPVLSLDKNIIQNTAIVGVQHILESVGSLMESFLKLGFPPQHIFLTGKLYSTNNEVEQDIKSLKIKYTEFNDRKFIAGIDYNKRISDRIKVMWKKVLKESKTAKFNNIIVFDEGGYVAEHIPQELKKRTDIKIIGIEQTTRGIRRIELFQKDQRIPTISVANSAAKQLLESPLIAKAILERTLRFLKGKINRKIGVIGLGTIGKALVNELVNEGYHIGYFDNCHQNLNPNIFRYNSIKDLLIKSEIIFGCTGEDISSSYWPKEINGNKILISCSSSDIEFYSLIMASHIAQKARNDIFEDIVINSAYGKGKIKILNGGYPINFDGGKFCVPNQDIQVTRGLMLSGVMMAIRMFQNEFVPEANLIMLDPHCQSQVVRFWFEDLSIKHYFDSKTNKKFNSSETIKAQSNGIDLSIFTESDFKKPKTTKVLETPQLI